MHSSRHFLLLYSSRSVSYVHSDSEGEMRGSYTILSSCSRASMAKFFSSTSNYLNRKNGDLKRTLKKPLNELKQEAKEELWRSDIKKVVPLLRELLEVESRVRSLLPPDGYAERLKMKILGKKLHQLITAVVGATQQQQLPNSSRVCGVWGDPDVHDLTPTRTRHIRVVGATQKRVKRAKRIVLSNKDDLKTAETAKRDFQFKGNLFFSKKLSVLDAGDMIATARRVHRFPLKKLRISSRLGITITKTGEIILPDGRRV